MRARDLCLLSCLLSAGCGTREAPSVPTNVVLITLDTTRADRLGSYGHGAAKTETLDALANAGLRFARAYSPAPLTIPAHSTIFTGLDPHHHGVRSNSDQVLPPEALTFAEILKAKGYQTGAATAAFVTQASWGFDQGFDVYMDDLEGGSSMAQVLELRSGEHNPWVGSRPADRVVDDALSVLEGFDPERPSFLWVHLFDPHAPYEPPVAYRKAFEKDPYSGELAFVDDQVQRLVDAVGDVPTLFVVVGDHGEGLGGHNQLYHGLYVYNDTQQVPFFLAGPGVSPGVVDQPVGLRDVLPTVLNQLGMPVPAGLDGKVQPGQEAPLGLESWELQHKYGYAPHLGIVKGRWKYIATPRPELYDLKNDPEELINLADEEKEVAEKMASALDALAISEFEGTDDGAIDPETLARLAALGYVGGDSPATQSSGVDPKDMQKVLIKLQRAGEARHAGRLDECAKLWEEALALDPDQVLVRSRLAHVLQQLGRFEEGKRWAESALEKNNTSVTIVMTAVMLRQETGDEDGAWALCEGLREAHPDSARVAEGCMTVLMNAGRREEGEALARAFLAEHPDAHNISAFLGVALATQARFKEAGPFLQAGLDATFPRRTLRQHLGMMWLSANQPGRAMTMMREELMDFPGNVQARRTLVRLLGKEDRHDEQLEQLEILLAFTPEDVRLLSARSEVLLEMGDLDGASLALEAAMKLAPEDADLTLLLANLQAARGQEEEGRKTFERAKALRARQGASPQ
jgi:arylsulfatase A-like enzyme/predicted Zn-dependent protease